MKEREKCKKKPKKNERSPTSIRQMVLEIFQGNDQNASPTNKKTAGSKLDRTS